MEITGITVGSVEHNNSFLRIRLNNMTRPNGHHLVGKNGQLNIQFRIQIEVSVSYNDTY